MSRVINIKRGHPLKECSNYVYVGRPTKWGNPFIVGKDGTREEVIVKYREWLHRQPNLITEAKKELRGMVLGCYCKPLPCHADVLLQIANDL